MATKESKSGGADEQVASALGMVREAFSRVKTPGGVQELNRLVREGTREQVTAIAIEVTNRAILQMDRLAGFSVGELRDITTHGSANLYAAASMRRDKHVENTRTSLAELRELFRGIFIDNQAFANALQRFSPANPEATPSLSGLPGAQGLTEAYSDLVARQTYLQWYPFYHNAGSNTVKDGDTIQLSFPTETLPGAVILKDGIGGTYQVSYEGEHRAHVFYGGGTSYQPKIATHRHYHAVVGTHDAFSKAKTSIEDAMFTQAALQLTGVALQSPSQFYRPPMQAGLPQIIQPLPPR